MFRTRNKTLFYGLVGILFGGMAFFFYSVLFPEKNYPTLDLTLDSPHRLKGVAVVDFKRVENESEPFKQLRSLIEDQHSDFNREIFNLENELRAEYQTLRREEKASQKPDEHLLQKRQDFDHRVNELEQSVLTKKQTLDQQFSAIKVQIDTKLNKILTDLAQEASIPLILNKNSDDVAVVLYADKALDLTAHVIERLNNVADSINLPE